MFGLWNFRTKLYTIVWLYTSQARFCHSIYVLGAGTSSRVPDWGETRGPSGLVSNPSVSLCSSVRYGAAGPSFTTTISRFLNHFSQWKRCFQRKLRSHWLNFLGPRLLDERSLCCHSTQWHQVQPGCHIHSTNPLIVVGIMSNICIRESMISIYPYIGNAVLRYDRAFWGLVKYSKTSTKEM